MRKLCRHTEKKRHLPSRQGGRLYSAASTRLTLPLPSLASPPGMQMRKIVQMHQEEKRRPSQQGGRLYPAASTKLMPPAPPRACPPRPCSHSEDEWPLCSYARHAIPLACRGGHYWSSPSS